MAQNRVSLNLSAANFTLSLRFKGPSVLIPGNDQNYYQATAGFAGETPQRGINIPQIDYCENTVPSAEGYRSVAYRYFIDPPEVAQTFIKILTIFDGNANSALLGVTKDRKLFIVSAYTSGKWQELPLPAGYTWPIYKGITNTTIRGSIAICIVGVGIFVVAPATNQIIPVTPLGIDATEIFGLCSSKGYAIVWDADTVYWSSTENAWDFTPSLITGAGSAKPEGAKGKIVLCKEIDRGFIIYCDASIISAAYSSNKAIPWLFAVLQGGAGIRHQDAVAYDINMSNHFVWTSSGFIGVELHRANPLFPELTDFIASGLSDKTQSFSAYPVTEFVDADKEVRISIVSSRYVCISFGYLSDPVDNEGRVPELEQSFIWDTQLKRWGKLNIRHIQIFEAPFAASPPVFF